MSERVAQHYPTWPNIAFDRDDEDGSGDVWCACGREWPCPDDGPPVPKCPAHLEDEPCATCRAYIAAGL